MGRGSVIHVWSKGTFVLGRRHPHPTGRVCVHILAPFGRCATVANDDATTGEELLARLFDVCSWSERFATELEAEDRRIRDALLGRGDALDHSGVVRALRQAREREIESVLEQAERFDADLERSAQASARRLGCRWPAQAADAWEFLAMNDFYRTDRFALA